MFEFAIFIITIMFLRSLVFMNFFVVYLLDVADTVTKDQNLHFLCLKARLEAAHFRACFLFYL